MGAFLSRLSSHVHFSFATRYDLHVTEATQPSNSRRDVVYLRPAGNIRHSNNCPRGQGRGGARQPPPPPPYQHDE